MAKLLDKEGTKTLCELVKDLVNKSKAEAMDYTYSKEDIDKKIVENTPKWN